MPNTSSAKKRLRQNLDRRQKNRAKKSEIRTNIRKVHEALSAGDVASAESAYVRTARKLDQAGAHRLIHPNKAARTKSRLQRLIKSAKSSA